MTRAFVPPPKKVSPPNNIPPRREMTTRRLYDATRLLSTVCARRFCDQHEMSLQTATGRSLPYEIVRTRFAATPFFAR